MDVYAPKPARLRTSGECNHGRTIYGTTRDVPPKGRMHTNVLQQTHMYSRL